MSFFLVPLLVLMLLAWIVTMTAGAFVDGANTPKARREMWPYLLLSLVLQLVVIVAAVNIRSLG